jgi:hypothetical protein
LEVTATARRQKLPTHLFLATNIFVQLRVEKEFEPYIYGFTENRVKYKSDKVKYNHHEIFLVKSIR